MYLCAKHIHVHLYTVCICVQNTSISIHVQYVYMYLQGHFRRAEARKIIASDMVTETDEQQKQCMDHLYHAMHEFMKCYEMMVDPKDQPSRLKQFCESVKMSIVLSEQLKIIWY